MTDEEKRIAISEACGWIYVGSDSCTRWYLSPKLAPLYANKDIPAVWREIDSGRSRLPDYLNDLNAIHEAEKTLDRVAYWNYADIHLKAVVWKNGPPDRAYQCATAAERADAFLITKGLLK